MACKHICVLLCCGETHICQNPASEVRNTTYGHRKGTFLYQNSTKYIHLHGITEEICTKSKNDKIPTPEKMTKISPSVQLKVSLLGVVRVKGCQLAVNVQNIHPFHCRLCEFYSDSSSKGAIQAQLKY